MFLCETIRQKNIQVNFIYNTKKQKTQRQAPVLTVLVLVLSGSGDAARAEGGALVSNMFTAPQEHNQFKYSLPANQSSALMSPHTDQSALIIQDERLRLCSISR